MRLRNLMEYRFVSAHGSMQMVNQGGKSLVFEFCFLSSLENFSFMRHHCGQRAIYGDDQQNPFVFIAKIQTLEYPFSNDQFAYRTQNINRSQQTINKTLFLLLVFLAHKLIFQYSEPKYQRFGNGSLPIYSLFRINFMEMAE